MNDRVRSFRLIFVSKVRTDLISSFLMDSSDFRLIAERKDAIRSPLATFGIALVITACAIGFPFPKAAANDTKPVIRALVSTSALRSQLMAITPQGNFCPGSQRVRRKGDESSR